MSETIAITARGMPTPIPTLALVDRPVEEVPVVSDVCVVEGEYVCVIVGEEPGGIADDGKSQPFTWIPPTTDSVCTVDVDMIQEEGVYVANWTT